MTKDAPIALGFDTSGPYCSVAVCVAGTIASTRHIVMSRGQGEQLFTLIDEVLAGANRSYSDLDAIGVGTGPGNFTGIRIGVSAARGLALSLGITAVGVPLMDALAEAAPRPALLCIKAPRDALYLQLRGRDGIGEIAIYERDDVPPAPSGTIVIGDSSEHVAAALGLKNHPTAYAHGSAIARITARRFRDVTDRPTPLYIRAPDAAPRKDAAIPILP